ncbi:MAG: hypothetical protein AAGB19_00420 [Cyanobacteria bacterium P01_F01_bin.3]
MSESENSRNIRIEESAVGSAIVSGDGNTIYVIQQTTEQKRVETVSESTADIGPNPYKGLSAFKEADAARYFGREVQIERLWQRFQSLYEQSEVPRFLPILGPSGCGKSSLARAGFIPELARKPLPGKGHMRVAVLVPGARPLESLAGVLSKAVTNDPFPVEKTEEFERVLKKSNEAGEYEGLRRIATLIPDIRDTPLVILVDQFEEVYSLCKEPESRRAFINNLLHAASEPKGEVAVVITLRSDFWGETQRHEKLNQVIGSDYVVTVPAMTTSELRSVIEEPAKQAGHPLDEATIELLVKDTEDREGALPLLQFALARIWDGLSEGRTPATTYRAMGGVGGALARKAQETYDRLSDSDKKIARRVFVGLVQLGEGTRDTRRRVRLDNLIAKDETFEKVQKVIHQFSSISARLITLSSLDGYEIAEVTHEALFEHWQQLNDWLDSSRDDIRFHRRLEIVAQYWDEQGRAEGLLWRSPDLDLLRTYQPRAFQDMTDIETAFWQMSEQAELSRKRTRKLVTGGLAIGFLLASFSTGIAIWNAQRANRKTQEANLNNVKALAQSAATLNASSGAFDALIMALRAEKQFSNNRLTDSDTLNQIKGEFYSSLFQEPQELTRFEGHGDMVVAVRFSPDGKNIATASLDGTAKLWNTDGNLIHTLEGHEDAVVAVRFSPDSKTIVTASRDNTSKLWDTDGNLIHTFDGNSKQFVAVRFSPIRVDTPQGLGYILATASDDNTVKLWNIDGSLMATLKGHSEGIWDMRFSPDGKTIATASDDNTTKLWNTDGSLIHTFEGHSKQVVAVRFSPNGKTIATASQDSTAKLWNIDGSLISTLKGHSEGIWDMRFSPDGETIATASQDNTTKLWNIDGTLVYTFEGHEDAVWDMRFSPDGKKLATASLDGSAKLWNTDGSFILPLQSHSAPVVTLGFSPDGNTIATASLNGTAKLWRTDSYWIHTLEGHADAVVAVRFSPDGNTIATASSDGTAKLWNTSGTLMDTLEGHKSVVRDVHFSPNGNLIVTASDDSTIKLWNTNGSLRTTFKGHKSAVRDVHFSPDGNTIATASDDSTAKLWNTDGSLVTTLIGHSDGVVDVRFSPDGNTIATASRDRTAKLWRKDGALTATLIGHSDEIVDVRFSPDGNTIATASRDHTAKLWSKDGTLIDTLEGHSDPVWRVRFSPDGKIATASRDGTAKLWNKDGTLMASLEGHSDEVVDVRFSPDGNTIATASRDHTARLWPLSLNVLISRACQQMGGYLRSSPNVQPEDRNLCD